MYDHLPQPIRDLVTMIHAELDRDAPYLIDDGERIAYNRVLKWVDDTYPPPKDPGAPNLMDELFKS